MSTARRRFSRLLRASLAVASLLTIGVYVLVATIAGAEPPSQPFPGWIALVSPENLLQDHVEIAVSPRSPVDLGCTRMCST